MSLETKAMIAGCVAVISIVAGCIFLVWANDLVTSRYYYNIKKVCITHKQAYNWYITEAKCMEVQ